MSPKRVEKEPREPIDFKDLRLKYNQKLSEVIFELFDQKGVPQEALADIFKDDYGAELNSGSVSKYKNNPNINISFVVLLKICELLEISVGELCDLVLNRIPDNKIKLVRDSSARIPRKYQQEMTILTAASAELINDSYNPVFDGYWGTYFAYFTPTYSSGEGILEGKLTLEKNSGVAHACFELETGQLDNSGNKVKKVYEGSAIISTAVKCCYCILSSKNIGEMFFITFRHFRINRGQLECRLAEVLTASSGGEDKYPTVLRMLISSEHIKQEDLIQLKPMLSLTNSSIIVSKREMEQLQQEYPEHSDVFSRIFFPETEMGPVYQIREDSIRSVWRDLKGKREMAHFVMAVREKEIVCRYNKIGKKPDDIIRGYLKERGYFKDTKTTVE